MDFDEYDDPKRRDMLAVIWRSHSMILKCIPSFSERTVCIIAEYAYHLNLEMHWTYLKRARTFKKKSLNENANP